MGRKAEHCTCSTTPQRLLSSMASSLPLFFLFSLVFSCLFSMTDRGYLAAGYLLRGPFSSGARSGSRRCAQEPLLRCNQPQYCALQYCTLQYSTLQYCAPQRCGCGACQVPLGCTPRHSGRVGCGKGAAALRPSRAPFHPWDSPRGNVLYSIALCSRVLYCTVLSRCAVLLYRTVSLHCTELLQCTPLIALC